MRLIRSTAASRVTQPRSTATMIAMTPKPEPPMATLSSAALAARRAPVGRKPADRVRSVPEEIECLALHGLEQLLIGQRGQRGWLHVISWASGFDSRFCPVSATICFFKARIQ